MTVKRMDNVGIVVEDIDAAIEFFTELGLELEGRAPIEGDWADGVTGLRDMRVEIAMMRTPDGHSRLELSRFLAPPVVADHRSAPVNALGYLRVMFTVEDIDDTLARLGKRGAELVGEVVQYEDTYRLCYIRGPEGILIGLAQELGQHIVNRKEGMKMTRVRVEGFTISLDGYGAGPNQDIRNPLGVGGTDLHQWLVPTRTFQRTLFGADGGTTGIDDDFAARGFKNVGAWILGRNMFGPIRGSWPDMNWKGWWGDNPPYHVPTFILTHHARPPIQMEGGTTFYFVTGGIHEALDRARDAANGMDVRIGGGPNTIQQYLRAGLIDELHVAISPVLLGGGERLFEGIDMRALGYECVQFVASEKATHVVLRRQGHNDA